MSTTNATSEKADHHNPRRLMTKGEVCDAYLISLATIDRLVRYKGFPHMKIGSRTLFRVEDVEGYFASLVRKND